MLNFVNLIDKQSGATIYGVPAMLCNHGDPNLRTWKLIEITAIPNFPQNTAWLAIHSIYTQSGNFKCIGDESTFEFKLNRFTIEEFIAHDEKQEKSTKPSEFEHALIEGVGNRI